MFKLHNGRIFKDLIGAWYILIIPAGEILFLLVLFSGISDWSDIKFSGKLRNAVQMDKPEEEIRKAG